MEVGGWVQVSLEKINNPILVLIFCGGITCIICLFTLLEVVCHYDSTVLSKSLMDFKKCF